MSLEKQRESVVKHPKVIFDPRKQTYFHHDEKDREPYIAPFCWIWMELPTCPLKSMGFSQPEYTARTQLHSTKEKLVLQGALVFLPSVYICKIYCPGHYNAIVSYNYNFITLCCAPVTFSGF